MLQFNPKLITGSLLCLLLLSACGSTAQDAEPPAPGEPHVAPPAGKLDWLAADLDYRPQDFADSRGVTAVRRGQGWPGLVLTAALDGKSAARAKGEVLLDTQFVAGLGGLTPLNLAGARITWRLWVPRAFVGNPQVPNGVQLFVKDDQWRSQYGAWTNVLQGGQVELAHTIVADSAVAAVTDPGFDPTRIRVIGLKVAIGQGSSATCQARFGVYDVTVDRAIALRIAPALPAAAPRANLVAKAPVTARPDGLWAGGARQFVVGGNYRAIDYGQNLGVTAWFPLGNGLSLHPGYLRAQLAELARAGVQWLRVGLVDDGRTLLDAAGHVTGYNATFQADVQALLDAAEQHGIAVELVLTDFLLAGKPEVVSGVTLRGRAAVFTNAAIRAAFVNDFVQPLWQRFGSHRALAAVDLVNEPEWFLTKADGGGWEDVTDAATKAPQPVPVAAFRAFVAACLAAQRAAMPAKLATVGVSARYAPLLTGLGLDYTAVHHYDWQGPLAALVPSFPAGLPWVLEECPTSGGASQVLGYLNQVRNLGGSGVLLWNLTPGADAQTMSWPQRNGVLEALSTWH